MTHLTVREAKLVRELTRGPAEWPLLADAMGLDYDDSRKAQVAVNSAIQKVRQKFGPVIVWDECGYRLRRL